MAMDRARCLDAMCYLVVCSLWLVACIFILDTRYKIQDTRISIIVQGLTLLVFARFSLVPSSRVLLSYALSW